MASPRRLYCLMSLDHRGLCAVKVPMRNCYIVHQDCVCHLWEWHGCLTVWQTHGLPCRWGQPRSYDAHKTWQSRVCWPMLDVLQHLSQLLRLAWFTIRSNLWNSAAHMSQQNRKTEDESMVPATHGYSFRQTSFPSRSPLRRQAQNETERGCRGDLDGLSGPCRTVHSTCSRSLIVPQRVAGPPVDAVIGCRRHWLLLV